MKNRDKITKKDIKDYEREHKIVWGKTTLDEIINPKDRSGDPSEYGDW